MKQHKWNKVEDKLPTHSKTVMTHGYTTANSDFCQAYFSFDENNNPRWQELDECGDFFDHPPTHWLELPFYLIMMQPLDNDEIRNIGEQCIENNNGVLNWIEFTRAIEKAHGIGEDK